LSFFFFNLFFGLIPGTELLDSVKLTHSQQLKTLATSNSALAVSVI